MQYFDEKYDQFERVTIHQKKIDFLWGDQSHLAGEPILLRWRPNSDQNIAQSWPPMVGSRNFQYKHQERTHTVRESATGPATASTSPPEGAVKPVTIWVVLEPENWSK